MPDQPDAALEEQLRQIIERLDPVPDELLAVAIASYTWRSVDSDLAELVFDSAAEENAALVRGSDQARLLTFSVRDLVIELQVSSGGHERRIVGQLTPPQPATVQIRQDGTVTDAGADDLGRFTGSLAAGPFSLACRSGTGGGQPVVTEWIAI